MCEITVLPFKIITHVKHPLLKKSRFGKQPAKIAFFRKIVFLSVQNVHTRAHKFPKMCNSRKMCANRVFTVCCACTRRENLEFPGFHKKSGY